MVVASDSIRPLKGMKRVNDECVEVVHVHRITLIAKEWKDSHSMRVRMYLYVSCLQKKIQHWLPKKKLQIL